jgi:S-adenosylmethionine:tRNA ribosyltransferase-isomerase
LLLHEGENPGEYVALMKPGRKLRPGEDVTFEGDLEAKVLEDLGNGRKRLRFAMGAEAVPMLQRVGQTPLPPYIKASLENPERYQTVYAGQAGSAAAPTAGLHFTQEILEALRAKGVRIASVTLDVSIDTFRPVTADDVRDHKIHGETCRVSPETADAVNTCRGRVVAVGTTSVRTLESFAVGRQRVEPGEKVSDLYITPGYEFQAIDGMFTNFHLPKTSMLLMVGALCGVERLMKAYEHAVRSNYRFLSFGDSMLVL